MLLSVFRELRSACRALIKAPWYSTACVLMLATGIGLALYMFGAINGFMLKPLPFPKPDELLHVELGDTRTNNFSIEVGARDLIELRAGQTQLQSLAGYYEGTVNLNDGERPERLDGVFATGDLMHVLGVQPMLGRALDDADERAGAAPVAVIGYTLWMNQFGGDRNVLGKDVRVNGRDAQIVGVMPPGFRFPRKHEIWVPVELDPARLDRYEGLGFEVFGRLRPQASEASVKAELQTLVEAIAAKYPDAAAGDTAVVKSFAREFISEGTRGVLTAMQTAVLLVLLIACANVANLMIARGATRVREMAVRGALGAGRARLMMHVLGEALVISLLACAIGLVGAAVGGEITMRAIQSSEDPPVYWVDFTLDGAGVLAAIVITLLTAFISGILPAIRAARTPTALQIRDGGNGTTGASGGKLARLLVIAEVALCMALLVGAGLSIRSVLNLSAWPTGVETEGVLTARVGTFQDAYPDAAARVRFFESLERRLAESPGVRMAALGSAVPAMDSGGTLVRVEGHPSADEKRLPASFLTAISPSYLPLFKVPVQSGRNFAATDTAEGARVAIVNRSFADRYWPGQDPVGKRIQTDTSNAAAAWITVVGVVPDIVNDLEDMAFTRERTDGIYVPFAQSGNAFMSVMMRADGDLASQSELLRRTIASLDPDLPAYWIRTVDDWIAVGLWDHQFIAQIYSVFAVFALLLAAAGIYAVLAYAVTQRTREIGVRRALGAQNQGILRMVIGQGAWQLGLGLAFGVICSLAFGRLLARMLFNVEPFDPLTFGGVALVLGLVAFLASVVPARRALRVQPMVALRYE